MVSASEAAACCWGGALAHLPEAKHPGGRAAAKDARTLAIHAHVRALVLLASSSRFQSTVRPEPKCHFPTSFPSTMSTSRTSESSSGELHHTGEPQWTQRADVTFLLTTGSTSTYQWTETRSPTRSESLLLFLPSSTLLSRVSVLVSAASIVPRLVCTDTPFLLLQRQRRLS